MKGGARRGTVLGRLPLGFARSPLRDDRGELVLRANGLPKTVPCIDPKTVEYRPRMFDLFVDGKKAIAAVRKEFNKQQVDDWNAWCDTSIRKLLWSSSALGIFIYNQTRREFDFDQEKWVVLPNPPSEWTIYHYPHLAIVSLEKWKQARRRIGASRRDNPQTGKPWSRNELSATTLFSGTLVCDYCKKEITLFRSAGPHKSFYCGNGSYGIHGCKLRTSKSTRIVETAITNFLRENVISAAVIEKVLNLANGYLIELSKRPKMNIGLLKAEKRSLQPRSAI
jgi:hypothetical protein